MTDKEFRHLSRRELIDIIYQMKKNEEELQKRLLEAEQKLQEREIHIAEAGSIAEAALQIQHIFEDAQAAADLYLESVKAVREKNE